MCTVRNHLWTHIGYHRYRKCSYTADLYPETSQCHPQTGSRIQSGTTADTDRNIYHTQHYFHTLDKFPSNHHHLSALPE